MISLVSRRIFLSPAKARDTVDGDKQRWWAMSFIVTLFIGKVVFKESFLIGLETDKSFLTFCKVNEFFAQCKFLAHYFYTYNDCRIFQTFEKIFHLFFHIKNLHYFLLHYNFASEFNKATL